MSRARSPDFLADFDSMTGMVRALGSFLHGEGFRALGQNPLLEIPAARVNLLPTPIRTAVYIASGWLEAFPPRRIDEVRAEELSKWVGDVHPRRRYQAVAIGSANGAATHLWAALGIPWLPQTFLLPVRQRVEPGDATKAMEMGIGLGNRLLEKNPDVQLHHMHDANQDRLMARVMTYFRIKRYRLGNAYRRFLEDRLAPGGTIIVVECEQSWGVTRVGERHVFQHGAVGGATEKEFHEGGPRVEAHLEGVGDDRSKWRGPPPEERAPEAEWGFEPAILDDIRELAAERHYKVVRMRFPDPEAPSPLVADLYRWWYRRRGILANRLIAESFVVMEPYWVLATGSVPFWMVFNMRPSLEGIHRYLDAAGPFDDLYMMMFSHGTESVGLPSVEEWETVFERARRHSGWLGADREAFPSDFAHFARYHHAIQDIPSRYPMPGPLTLSTLWRFLEESDHRYEVRFEGESVDG